MCDLRVYLAGPIFDCEDNECVDWRRKCRTELVDCIILDPMARDYRGKTDENYREIVEQDKADIDDSDVVLVHHLKASIGTSMEVLYAWQKSKHVIVYAPQPRISPWLLYHSHRIFRDFGDALSYIRNLQEKRLAEKERA